MKNVTSAKMLVKEDWVTAAMTDNQMVVELLIRLKHAEAVVSDNQVVSLPVFRWGIRKRRSRFSRFGGRSDVLVVKKDFDSVRASPKTPLSWSGGSGSGGVSTSPSAATVDGFEDTSRQTSCSTSTGTGSKLFPTSEITSSFYKRLNKKKSSSSKLKDEENIKLKERLVLQKEIASLRVTFDEQHVRNQKLKRIKLDLNSSRVKNETTIDSIPKSQLERLSESKSCRGEENQRSFFFLPDLNMVPSEDEILYGTS